ncbi:MULTISPECIES: flagellin [unclassified Phyllobacterium]|jgi:flagellin|uniref:flagellin N-terminal helical domain-containing protein n=1 Tax=Phyllobacterium TaxID=28100 RepID=UPI000885D680|nr:MULTISPECIES: flagellin [unclassified Phyllobacterium]MBA8903548.1 flagellin [Phyllobacterium sp. P30BS-XVII]UGX89050.1 flagellin [Phyllobacterium sp. T1293]SDP79580.1 flagellin [Phyllobacterium sp. OV277]
MSSILTNASAMTALQTLSVTNKNLATTQNRIATGLKISEASDNAAYWSIATTMRSDNGANSVIQDALGLGSGKVDTAYAALNKAIDSVNTIKNLVLSSKNASVDDRKKNQEAINAAISALKENAGASYAGSNLLSTDSTNDAVPATANFSVVASYNRNATTGAVTTGSIDVALKNTRLIDTLATGKTGILDKEFAVTPAATGATTTQTSILTIDVSGATIDNKALDDILTGVEAAVKGLASGASQLGAAKSRIDTQKSFISALSDAVDRGIGSLVDADMNKESARLSALQVQQQLGVQALSIANASNQSIQQLFRG